MMEEKLNVSRETFAQSSGESWKIEDLYFCAALLAERL
jgi:hypothetical protein